MIQVAEINPSDQDLMVRTVSSELSASEIHRRPVGTESSRHRASGHPGLSCMAA